MSKIAVWRSYWSMDQNRFYGDTSRSWEESICKVRRHSSTGYGGNAITEKIQDGRQRPYLSSDGNQIWTCTTRPPGEYLRQVSKKSDRWFQTRQREIIYGRTDVRTPDSYPPAPPPCGMSSTKGRAKTPMPWWPVLSQKGWNMLFFQYISCRNAESAE